MKKDLTGLIFGNLKVLRRERIDGATKWLCACSCGTECYAHAHHLMTGKKKCCGRNCPKRADVHIQLKLKTNPKRLVNENPQKNSASKILGVTWSKQMQKWRAEFTYQKKRYFLGLYDDINEADNAVKQAKLELTKKEKLSN